MGPKMVIVIDVLDREIELVLMALIATEPWCRDRSAPGITGCRAPRTRAPPVVEDLGRGDRSFAVIELGEGDLGIGVDESLLIESAKPFSVPTAKVSCAPQPPGH